MVRDFHKIKTRVIGLLLLGLTTMPLAAEAGPLSSEQRKQIAEAIESYKPRVYEIADTLWATPELGFLETKTSALLGDELKSRGFEVQFGIAGMPTGFVARKQVGSGGPVIAILAEMDALPGFSQAAVPEKTMQQGLDNGHACGHHLFGAGSTAAAIVAADWLETSGLSGEIRVYGSPAEEGGGGKVYMVREGAFDGVDVVLFWHPADMNDASQYGTLASISAKVRFTGKAAHAAVAPDQGRSALDGVEAMHHMINLMREHVTQGTLIHYVTTRGGEVPNVVPSKAESQLIVRHSESAEVEKVFAWIEAAARGAALGTQTEVEIERASGVYSVLTNDTLGQIADANLRATTPITWTPEEVNFANKIRTTLGNRQMPAMSAVEDVSRYKVGRSFPASTDVGDVSWTVPTVGVVTATWVPGTNPHTWQAVAAGGMSIGHKGMAKAAETLAAIAAELYQSPEVIEKAKQELKAKRGKDFHYSALMGDRSPPLDYNQSPK